MFKFVPPALTHAEILRPRDATELNNDSMVVIGDDETGSPIDQN